MMTGKQLVKKYKVIILSVTITIFTFYMVLYGPFTYLRETWVTSALTTMSHDWLATIFYSRETLQEIKAKNYYKENKEVTNPNLIKVKYQKDKDIEIEKVKGDTYTGYLMKIYDPSLLQLVGVEKTEGKGKKVKEFVEENNAVAGINCNNFVDDDGHSAGVTPAGFVMIDGVVTHSVPRSGLHAVGFTEDNVMILGYLAKEQLDSRNVKDAFEFGPYLIVNGKPSTFVGNGGAGLAPRTVLGQTADGTFLLLVIDGRQLATLGASFVDVTKIMQEHGAINAVNLDGGSSSIMYYDNKTVNFPINSWDGRYLPNALVVMAPEKFKDKYIKDEAVKDGSDNNETSAENSN